MKCFLKQGFVYGICLFSFFTPYAQDSTRTKELVDDPSLVPVFNSDGNPAYRWRMYGDINKDGLEDIIVSESFENMSQNGVNLFIYFADSSGKFFFYDTTFSTPRRLCFERDLRGIRLWEYWHIAASTAIIGYSWLADSGITQGQSMELNPGDAGGRVSNAVVTAIFGNSDVQFRTQTYQIIDGKVRIERESE